MTSSFIKSSALRKKLGFVGVFGKGGAYGDKSQSLHHQALVVVHKENKYHPNDLFSGLHDTQSSDLLSAVLSDFKKMS